MHNHYYQTELPEEVLDILVSKDDPVICNQEGYEQEPPDAYMKAILNQMCIQGRVVVFVYEDKVAIVVTRQTAWVGKFDTKVSGKATARDVVKCYKEFVPWAKENTFYNKLETRTPLEKFAKIMAKAGHAELEGVLKKSYRTREGKMIDEYLVGVVLREEE